MSNMTDEEFRYKYLDILKVLTEALSKLSNSNSEMYLLSSFFDTPYDHCNDDHERFARNIIVRMREYRKADSDLKNIQKSVAVLKALL